MSTHLKEPIPCPNCGKPLSAGALAGLCPACLLAQGMETERDEGQSRQRFEPPPLAQITKLFPQLEVLGLLGAGGMGAVYKARQPALDRVIALKVLPAKGPGGGAFSERFNREARALARLSHPNIVTVHEFGQAGDLHFFIMEFVDGANLRQLEQAKRLAPREALQIIPQICDALQYAHDEGVVHRDIKPENVLVDRKGRVKIADFGLAKILGNVPESVRLTAEGQVMGTPHYMAPEQFERPLTVDHRADIYSLGVVFYEMLTGDLPLGKFAPPSCKVQVDVRLDEIVLRALENDPARRYQQVSEVKSGVATVADMPIPANAATTSAPQARVTAPESGMRHLRWLGIPAVVERGGEREVDFQGALGVVFVMLMTSALAQQAVRWGTGSEHAMVQLSFVTAGMMAIWAIRRTLNQPANKAPLRRRYAVDGLMMVGLVAFVVSSHYLKIHIINPRLGIGATTAPIEAKADPTTGVMIASFQSGGTVELLAVNDADSGTNPWWRPDGSPAAHPSLEIRGPRLAEQKDQIRRDFLFRLTGLPPGATAPGFAFDSLASISLESRAFQDESLLPETTTARVSFRGNPAHTSVRLTLGLEPWRTVATHTLANHTTKVRPIPGGPELHPRFSQVSDRGGGAQVRVAFEKTPSWAVRIVAVDLDGVEHQEAGSPATNSKGIWVSPEDVTSKSHSWTYDFSQLPLEKVREFRAQIRPLQEVVFKNVSLWPSTTVMRDQNPRFDPPTLLSFNELVDLDTGHASGFPPAEPGGNPFADIGEHILWAQENGFDASAGAGKLELLSVTVAEISDAEWESMTPHQAEARLATSGTKPRELTPLHPERGTTPAYAFRTREGGVGLIRFVEFRRESTKLTVQFRNVRLPAGAFRVIPARRDRYTGEQVSRLPGLGTVTLVALRAAGSTNWSRPDGAPAQGVAPQFGLDFDRSFAKSNVAGRLWQVLLRAEQLPSPEDQLTFEFPGALNRFFTGGAMVPQGGANPGMVSLHVLWPDSATHATMRVGVPMAPWHPIRSFDPLSRSLTKTSWGDEPKWNIEMHTAGVGTQGAQITVVFGTNYPGWKLRLTAKRASGDDVLGLADASVTNGPATTSTYVFPNITKLDEVLSFQVQAQPLAWAQFSNLSLAASNRPLHP